MSSNDDLKSELKCRVATYEAQLKKAEEEKNNGKVRRYKRIVAQYEKCIRDIECGREPVLLDLPNPPNFAPLIASSESVSDNADINQTSSSSDASIKPLTPSSNRKISEQSTLAPDINLVEDEPENLIDKLSVRLKKYNEALLSAQGDAPKERRYKRIIKQYGDAINRSKAGEEVDLAQLPNPHGFQPLVPQSSPTASPLPARFNPSSDIAEMPAQTKSLSRAEKQTILLRNRQKEYRDAALNAKRAGQIPEAKEFLKICKGFDRLINASEGGLPVDLTTIPHSPNARAAYQPEADFVIVTDKDFSGSSNTDVYEMIKNELQEQIKSCVSRISQLKGVGDISNSNKFEQKAAIFKQDLNKVIMLQAGGQCVPKFHYEQKTFPIVHSFSDIGAGEVELTIVQAVGLPKTVDSYVAYEFPYPAETPPSGYTSVVKNTDSPTFDFKTTFSIDRDNKQCQRIFKRQGQSGIKLELWSRSGFLRKDVSMGTVNVKLLPLTTDLLIHDAFELMNGRRPAAGKLEVKVRVREPILAKKIENITEKWLIID